MTHIYDVFSNKTRYSRMENTEGIINQYEIEFRIRPSGPTTAKFRRVRFF